MAAGLGLPDEVFTGLAVSLSAKRDRLLAGLEAAELEVAVPRGTYFVVADVASLGVEDAMAWCLELPARAGVGAIPVSAFHDDPDAARTLVRFAFCKQDEVLDEGCRRLAALRTG